MGMFAIGSSAFGVGDDVLPVDRTSVKGCNLHNFDPNIVHVQAKDSDARCAIAC